MKVFQGKEYEYSIDGYLASNLDIAKEAVHKDWDMVFCVDGSEGSGKSTIAIQSAKYCDESLDNSRIVFTPTQFRKAIINAEKFQSVVYDEAYTGLSSRATMSLINRTLISMLAEIRQRNLFVFVVMPCFFDLDKYVALWRSRALIHVYTKENFQRGYFAFFNYDRKKLLYINGKKYYNYNSPNSNFTGRFTSFLPINKIEYLKNKKESLIAREKKIEEDAIKKEIEGALFERIMSLEDGKLSHKVKMEVLGLKPSTYFNRLSKWKEQSQLTSLD